MRATLGVLAAGVLVLSFYSQPLLDYLTRIASGLV